MLNQINRKCNAAISHFKPKMSLSQDAAIASAQNELQTNCKAECLVQFNRYLDLFYFIFFFNLLDFLAVEGAKESSQVDRDICPYLICWWGRYWRGR